MNQDLKTIKKKYGEKMAHFCRDYFATILETEGLLIKLLLDNFEPSHDLYEDIVKQNKEAEFKNYIYSLIDVEKNKEIKVVKTPEYLLSEVGYDLYECKSEEDIQKFKKYYAKNEELCTFKGGRLDRCYVFFAVKKNVDKIKREDYSKPQRQDEYGTSVISIQFTKDESHTLSIKNRYNHTVNNPDSTFSNNLDNIILGLTESFGEHYGLVQKHSNNKFELGGYVRADEGKYYKYNQEINNIYYCPNNVIIDNYEVKRYDKEKYIIFDYFILDLVNKEIRLYDESIFDSFPSTISNIQKIEVKREEDNKEIIITLKDNKIVVTLNKENQMIKLDYPKLEQVENDFLVYIKYLKDLDMVDLQKVGCDFLSFVECLQELKLPSLEEVGDRFLIYNRGLKKIDLPLLKKVGRAFLFRNKFLEEVNLPSLEEVGDNFLSHDAKLKSLSVPVLREVGNDFIHENTDLRKLDLPNLRIVGKRFLQKNNFIRELNAPYLEKVGVAFLYNNTSLRKLDLLLLKKIGDYFLYYNSLLEEVNLPYLESVGVEFLFNNTSLRELNLPSLKKVGHSFLYCNNLLEAVNLPSLEEIGDNFLESHPTLTKEDFIQKIKR